MNKSELIAAIAEKSGMAKKDADKALAAVISSIVEEVANGGKVQLVGFGTFEGHERKARMGKNPATGAAMEIPASVVPSFKAGKAFKETVNAAKAAAEAAAKAEAEAKAKAEAEAAAKAAKPAKKARKAKK